MFCLVCKWTQWGQCPGRPEEGLGALGPGVIVSHLVLCGCWDPNRSPPQEHWELSPAPTFTFYTHFVLTSIGEWAVWLTFVNTVSCGLRTFTLLKEVLNLLLIGSCSKKCSVLLGSLRVVCIAQTQTAVTLTAHRATIVCKSAIDCGRQA